MSVRLRTPSCNFDRVAAPPIVALSPLGFVWPKWPAAWGGRRSSGTIVRNKKPGAVVPPGLGRTLLDRAFLI
jgi:hypothetical protein